MPRTILLSITLLWACSPSAVVSDDSEDTLEVGELEIVNGVRQPTAITLTARQKLGVGAVLESSGGWSNICTGTLITPTLVLTAAHCVEGLTRTQLAFAVGTNSESPLESQVPAAVYSHSGYDPDGDAEHDVAVLRFTTGFAKADPIAPNCDALSSSQLVGKTVQLVGYGATANDDFNATQWWVAVPTTSMTAYDFTVNGRGKGACEGDSGGPALLAIGGSPRIVGTLSWGNECGYQDHFARVDDNCAFLRTIPGFAAPPASAQTVEGVTFTSAQATSALKLANTATVTTLDDAVGLDRRAAEAIVSARPLTNLQSLASVAYVGSAALTRLRDH